MTAKPGSRDACLAAFRAAHVDADGIGPLQAKFGPDAFVVLESWESPEARP
jgi:hypothetical protein